MSLFPRHLSTHDPVAPRPVRRGRLAAPSLAITLFLAAFAVQGQDDDAEGPCYLIYGQPMGECSPAQAQSLLDSDVTETLLPAQDMEPSDIEQLNVTETVELVDNDSFSFVAQPVATELHGREVTLYGYNASIPGPALVVRQGSTVILDFGNRIDQPTTIHWHGIRIQDRYDGTPFFNQVPIEPGDDFRYFLWTRDAGFFWYHSHFREDMQQNAGLYGTILVRPVRAEDWPEIHNEQILVLSDILLDDSGVAPYGAVYANHALAGRMGNYPVVNGRDEFTREANRGEVVRFYMVNAANARPFQVTFDGAPVKRIGGDIGLYEREEWVEEVMIYPGQRRIVDVRFEEARTYTIRHEGDDTQWTLGTVDVADTPAQPDLEAEFQALLEHPTVTRDIDRFRLFFDRPVDRELLITMRASGDPGAESVARPAETTTRDARWVIMDILSEEENLAINMNFRVGDLVKLSITNDEDVAHPMVHTLHLHGQRFLILTRDEESVENLVWTDTAHIKPGETIELLADLSNAGDWMFRSHIAEHLQGGMAIMLRVGS